MTQDKTCITLFVIIFQKWKIPKMIRKFSLLPVLYFQKSTDLLVYLKLVILRDFSIKYIISYLTEPNMIHPNQRYQNTDLKIVSSSIDTKATSQEIPKIKECRICLENSQESDKKFISPCKCIGSVEYVHQQCIRAWIKSSLQSKSRWERFTATKDGLQCEMCKELIKFTERTQIQCRDCEGLAKVMKQKKIILIVVILLIVISLGGVSICLVNMLDLLSYRGDIQFELILSMCGIILLFVFFAVAIYTAIVEFFLMKKMVIGAIQDRQVRKNQSVSSLTIIDIV